MKYLIENVNEVLDVKSYLGGFQIAIDQKPVYGSNDFGYCDEMTAYKVCKNYFLYIITSPKSDFVSVVKFLLDKQGKICKSIRIKKIFFEKNATPHQTFVGKNLVFFCLNDSSQIVIVKRDNLELIKIFSSKIPVSFHESSTLDDKNIFATALNGNIYQIDWKNNEMIKKTENQSGAITYASDNYLWFNCANNNTSLIGSKSSGIHRVDRNNNVEYFPSFPNNLGLEVLGCQCARPLNDNLVFVCFLSGAYFGYYKFTSSTDYKVRLFNLKLANIQFIENIYNPKDKTLYLISTSLITPNSIDALVRIPNFDKVLEDETITEITDYEIYPLNNRVSTHRVNLTPNNNNVLVTLSGRGSLFISN